MLVCWSLELAVVPSCDKAYTYATAPNAMSITVASAAIFKVLFNSFQSPCANRKVGGY